MDFILAAKQRMNKMALTYSGRSHRAKKMNPYAILITKILRLGGVRATIKILLLAMILLSLPSLISVRRSAATSGDPDSSISINNYFKMLPILCHDLIDEGLIKKGHKGLILGAGSTDIDDDYVFLKDTGVNLTTEAGLEEKKVVENDHAFDFVFTPRFSGIKLIDRVVKNGGMAISPLSNNLMHELHSLNNYKIVYLRIFKNTVVAMRKANQPDLPKESAISALQNVYLEGPLARPVTACF